jgi:hypothetical protein
MSLDMAATLANDTYPRRESTLMRFFPLTTGSPGNGTYLISDRERMRIVSPFSSSVAKWIRQLPDFAISSSRFFPG